MGTTLGRGEKGGGGGVSVWVGFLIWALLGRLNLCSWGSELKKDGNR